MRTISALSAFDQTTKMLSVLPFLDHVLEVSRSVDTRVTCLSLPCAWKPDLQRIPTLATVLRVHINRPFESPRKQQEVEEEQQSSRYTR